MGGLRLDVERLAQLLPDPTGAADGQVITTKSSVNERGITQYGYVLEPASSGSGQSAIQFEYNGTDLGTSGTVDEFDLVSSWATLARAGNAVTLTIPTPSLGHSPGCIFTNEGLFLTGTLTSEIYIPYSGTITGWTILGDVSGAASIVVSNATYANYDTMTTLLTATLSSAKKNQSTGLSIAVVAGALRFSGSGFSSLTRCSIVLTVS